MARGPLQPPVAVQAVAFVDVHDRVELAPLATVVGAAVSVTVGRGLLTVTVADAVVVVPLAAEHTRTNVVVAVRALENALPLVASEAVQPPVAAHDVVPVELQVSAEVWPLSTAVGDALNVTVGTVVFVVDEVSGEVVGLTPLPQAVRAAAATAAKNLSIRI